MRNSTVYADSDNTRYAIHPNDTGYAIGVFPVNEPMYLLSNTDFLGVKQVAEWLERLASDWNLRRIRN